MLRTRAGNSLRVFLSKGVRELLRVVSTSPQLGSKKGLSFSSSMDCRLKKFTDPFHHISSCYSRKPNPGYTPLLNNEFILQRRQTSPPLSARISSGKFQGVLRKPPGTLLPPESNQKFPTWATTPWRPAKP